MRILLINSVCGTGSTGRLCAAQAAELERAGHTVRIAYGRRGEIPGAVRIGSKLDVYAHWLGTRLLDTHGFGSRRATEKFLRWAEEFDPELLWLHNLHGYYLHVGLLFDWIKSRPQMEVKWTLHDCWAFTGHCAYFTAAGCGGWKTGCGGCPQRGRYPASLADRSEENFQRKKHAFTGVKHLTLVTPSQWLADLTRESFLGEYPVEVRPNRVDTQVFRPVSGNFRRDHGLTDKKLILGVAGVWEERKGLGDFLRLAELVDHRTVIVLVGLTARQRRGLPENILALPPIRDPMALAELYSAADLFFNPTYEDNYPTVNLEAEACGTRVVTYAAGGAPETIRRPDSLVIPVGSYDRVPSLL